MDRRNYGLFTAITMITGVVIGSGIFFKSDDVLRYTGGNALLGILVFLIAASAIIFGSLTVSQLANLTDKPGGLIAYAEEFVGMGTACVFGWFHTFLYLPALVSVVSSVSGIFICQLTGLKATLENSSLIGFAAMTVLFAVNMGSAKTGGLIQNGAMVIKLIPLFFIAAAGLAFGNPDAVVTADLHSFPEQAASFGWMTAFAPIAFSFDGWIVSTSIGSEIKNSKRNLPIALTISPLIILFLYVAYYFGITSLVGAETILTQEDTSVYTVSERLFGSLGGKFLLTFVVISVLGTVNGIILAFIRMPYSLALRNMIPLSQILRKENVRFNHMPLQSAVTSYTISLGWMLVHYVTQKSGMRGDVSEIAIGVSYLNYMVLYLAVIRLKRMGKIKGRIKGYFIPVLAMAGSLVILSGSITHPLFFWYVTVCFLMMGAGAVYYMKNKKTFYDQKP